jgi:O-glycosyl hydrolase
MYKKIGADVYALSFQNEPAFVEFYDSCVYTAEEYVAMFNTVAPIVKAAHPGVLLFGAEGMLVSEVMGHPVSKFHEALLQSEASMRHLDRFAVHGYSVDGVTPADLSAGRDMWEKHAKMVAPSGKTSWMSETSGYAPQWNPPHGGGRLAAATALQYGLSHGNLSGWIWWQGSEASSPGRANLEGDTFLNAGGRTRSFYAHKQFYRFIRPGSTRIGSAVAGTEHDTDLLVTAWQNEALQNTVITFVNTSKNTYSVAISGAGELEYEYFITSATEACESKGNVVNNVLIPPESVVTLVNGKYVEGE